MANIPTREESKRSKVAVLRLLKAAGMFALARVQRRAGIRILCYHGVWPRPEVFAGDSMFVSEQTFERRLALIQRLNFNVVSLDQAAAALRNESSLRDSVVITIDDGWHSTFASMLPALTRFRMHATIYCDTKNLMSGLPVPQVMARYLRQIHAAAGELPANAVAAFSRATDLTLDSQARYSAVLEFADKLSIDVHPYLTSKVFSYMTQDEIVEAARQGFAIELHSHTHSLGDFSFEAVAAEISANRKNLGQLLGAPPEHFRHFCYPSGKVTPRAVEALRKLSVVTATTLESGIAYRNSEPLLLPRIVDGDHLSELEFEAQLCGVGDFLRSLRSATRMPFRPAGPRA